jgi:hypothetical protein
VEIVRERNRASASVGRQGSLGLAAQDVFAVLGLLAQEPVKIEAASTRVARLCAALDSSGAEQMLGDVAKGAAPDEHHHCGIKGMGKSSHSCSVGGVDLKPD